MIAPSPTHKNGGAGGWRRAAWRAERSGWIIGTSL